MNLFLDPYKERRLNSIKILGCPLVYVANYLGLNFTFQVQSIRLLGIFGRTKMAFWINLRNIGKKWHKPLKIVLM